MKEEFKNIKEELQKCYKKLKSSAYFDKSSSILKKQIAEFELADFEGKLDEIENILISEDEAWNDYVEKKLREVIAYLYPKEIDKEEDKSKNKIIFNTNNNDEDINIKVNENIQFKIGLPIELHILGVLWIIKIGYKLDENFIECSYGNRLLENNTEKRSPYLFKPYFNEYESWRDRGIEVAEKYYKLKENSIILMLDIRRFFYSVNFTKEIFESFLEGKENLILVRINELVFRVLETYSNIVNNNNLINKKGKNIFLPIGYLPSSILSNWYLDSFDKNIIDRINPSYYGRYVDDIIIVDKVEKKSELYKLLSSKNIDIESIMNKYFIDNREQILIKDSKITVTEKSARNKNYIINFTDKLRKKSKLEVKKDKIRIFYLEAEGTKSVLDKFKETIKNNTSEFRLLPDGENIFLENYNDIYKLNQKESINKLRGIESIEIDKYELSKFIGKNLTVANVIHDSIESKFYEDLEKIFQPKVIIQNYLLWENILNLCIVNKRIDKFKLIIKKILEAIDKIKENHESDSSGTYYNIKDTLRKYLFSSVIRSSTLVWGKTFEKNITKILEKINEDRKKVINLRKGFLRSRMINKSNMIVLLDNLYNYHHKLCEEECLYLNDFNLIIEFLIKRKFKYENILSSEYKYRPYLVTMQDINKILFLIKAIEGKALNENSFENKRTSDMIEDLYYEINYFKELPLKRKNRSVISVKYLQDKVNKMNIFNNNTENYNIIKIGKGNRKNIKVAIAIAKNEEDNFISILMDEPNRDLKRYKQLSEIIRQTVQSEADILILPENYIPFEWLGLLEREAKKNNLAIITGVEHVKIDSNVYNLTVSFFPYEYSKYKFVYTNYRSKVYYSPEEKRQIEGYGCICVEGNEFNLFVWNNIWIPVYCCFEIASILDRSTFFSLADLIVTVEWNKDINYFSNIIESLSRDMHAFCVQVNTSNYGDSCLIQPAKTHSMSLLRTKGGINSGVLVEEIDIDKLRRFQVKEYELQKDDKSRFKTTPPNFNKDIVRKKITNSLFEEILRK